MKPPKKASPWVPKACPFCQQTHAGKLGLNQHLHQYVGALRLPADGIHDVLEINKLLYPSSNQHDKRLQCPGCPMQMSDQTKFTQHVVNKEHYGRFWDDFERGVEGRCQTGPWKLPFNEEIVLVTERKGVFNFISLPYEVRQLVYDFVLVFDSIEIGSLSLHQCKDASQNEHGVWLQHNPKHNLLSLLAVNRQIYEESRRVFYSRNSFVFDYPNALLIFLFGIGPENARLLRSVESTSSELNWDLMDAIRSCLADHEVESSDKRPSTWNDAKLQEHFFKRLDLRYDFMRPARKILGNQLFRPGADRPASHSLRKRYRLCISLCVNDHFDEEVIPEERRATATYELYGE